MNSALLITRKCVFGSTAARIARVTSLLVRRGRALGARAVLVGGLFLCLEPMMLLSADQRRALVMLATAGQAGVARALLSAHGFDAIMIAGLGSVDIHAMARKAAERWMKAQKLVSVLW